MDKPAGCDWCLSKTTDLSPYHVFFDSRDDEPQVWWLSPCCVKDILFGDDDCRWILEAVEEGEDEA